MWGWIIQVTIISLLLIFLLHYLYSFFKTTLTSPKLKDLVNKPQEKYNTIYNSLQSVGNGGSYNLGEGRQTHINDNSTISVTSGSTSMKDELKRYLNDLNGSNSNSSLTSNTIGYTNTNANTNVNTNVNANTSIINSQNEINSVYSPDSLLKSIGGANGISTRVNNIPNYMQNIDKIGTSTETPDFGTPSMSSSYASAYSSY